MERPLLDALYAARPHVAFRRALSDLDGSSAGFLRHHVEELEVEQILQLLAYRDDGGSQALLVRALAARVRDDHAQLVTLQASDRFAQEAWLDLTLQLRPHLPSWQWFRFVDKVRGCALFNALNHGFNYDPDCFVTSIEVGRPEPSVLPLLTEPHNELAARKFVETLPLSALVRAHERAPDALPQEVVRAIAARQTEADAVSWEVPLPTWLAPEALKRVRGCPESEAAAIFRWLTTLPTMDDNLFAVAIERLRRAPHTREWPDFLGSRLNTGKAWKALGRPVVEVCVDLQGVPYTLTNAALASVEARDGASKDQHERAVLAAMHDVAAVVLIERASAAAERGAWGWARSVLEALMNLDPGSFVAPRLHHLLRAYTLQADVARDVETCRDLFKRPGGRSPSLDAFHQAFFALRGEA